MNVPDFFRKEHGAIRESPLFCHTRSKRINTGFIDKGIQEVAFLWYFLQKPPQDSVLRNVDSAVKLISAFLLLIAISLITNINIQFLIAICLLCIILFFSNINVTQFYKRVLLLSFVFGFLLSFPSSFNIIVDGELVLPLFRLKREYNFWIYHIPQQIGITYDGIERMSILTMKVMNSVTTTFLLLRTMYFEEIIKSLRSFKVSSIFLTILMLAYRYIILFARIVEDFYLAKKARFLGRAEKYMIENWFTSRIHFLFRKTIFFSEEVSSAMNARLAIIDRRDKAITESSVREDKNVLFKLENINYSYNRNISALVDINLEVKPEERFAIIGANGAGKSTLLKVMAGLLFPGSGRLFFEGKPVTEKSLQNIEFLKTFRSSVGFVFQDPDVQLFSATVLDELIYGPLQLCLPRDEAVSRAEQVMEMLEIKTLKDRPPYMLSGGEKKKVAIGSVLTMNPEVLLLDEPTSGLDPRTQCFLMELIVFLNSEIKKSIIIATHDLSVVDELQAKVAVLGENHRIEKIGTAEEILADQHLLLSVNLIHEHIHYHRDTVHRHLHSHYFFHKHSSKTDR